MTTTREPCRRGRGRRRKGALLALLLVAATSTAAAAAASRRHGPTTTSMGLRSSSSSSSSSSSGFVFPHLCERQPRRAVGLEGPFAAHRSGGGGGGKSSKEKRRERGRGSGASSSSSSSSPAQSFSSSFSPPADADEMPMLYDKDGVETTGGKGNKPAQWPNKVLFSQKLKWAPSSAGQDIKESFRRRLLPGIEVRYITEPSHVLKGQYGVYATREFAPFDVMGEYVGRVVPPEVGGEYVATIDWEDCRFADGAGHLWGVDSALYGNEVRMINHFHRIGPVPNVKFVTAYIAELPHILVVVVRPIPIGAEVLIDYGPNYWCGQYHAPPAEPPGIDDPPEEEESEKE